MATNSIDAGASLALDQLHLGEEKHLTKTDSTNSNLDVLDGDDRDELDKNFEAENAVLTAIHKRTQDRQLVLDLRDKIHAFFLDSSSSTLQLEEPNGYHRLVCHKMADLFHLDHSASSSTHRIVLTKIDVKTHQDHFYLPHIRGKSTWNSRVDELLKEADEKHDAVENFTLIKRPNKDRRKAVNNTLDTSSHTKDNIPFPTTPENSDNPNTSPPPNEDTANSSTRIRTLSERENDYRQMRARIFSDEEKDVAEQTEAGVEHSVEGKVSLGHISGHGSSEAVVPTPKDDSVSTLLSVSEAIESGINNRNTAGKGNGGNTSRTAPLFGTGRSANGFKRPERHKYQPLRRDYHSSQYTTSSQPDTGYQQQIQFFQQQQCFQQPNLSPEQFEYYQNTINTLQFRNGGKSAPGVSPSLPGQAAISSQPQRFPQQLPPSWDGLSPYNVSGKPQIRYNTFQDMQPVPTLPQQQHLRQHQRQLHQPIHQQSYQKQQQPSVAHDTYMQQTPSMPPQDLLTPAGMPYMTPGIDYSAPFAPHQTPPVPYMQGIQPWPAAGGWPMHPVHHMQDYSASGVSSTHLSGQADLTPTWPASHAAGGMMSFPEAAYNAKPFVPDAYIQQIPTREVASGQRTSSQPGTSDQLQWGNAQ